MGPQQLLAARLLAVGMTSIVIGTFTKKYILDRRTCSAEK